MQRFVVSLRDQAHHAAQTQIKTNMDIIPVADFGRACAICLTEVNAKNLELY
jgi:hypothetical protein